MAEPRYTPLEHRSTFVVRTFDIDRTRRLTVPALVRLMHEAAMQNVLELKLSVWDLEPRGLTWVLLRQRLQVDRLPGLGEPLSIVTHPSGMDRLYTYRDFRVFDRSGEPIAWASTAWMLLDIASRRARRLPDFVLALEEQLPDPARCLPRPAAEKFSLGPPDRTQQRQVQYFDLDFNQHLNNTRYLKWMLETLPDEVLLERHCRTMHLEYRAECHWKARVQAEVAGGGDGRFVHRLVRVEDGKDLALATSTWQ